MFKFPVWRLCPVVRNPTWLISGQSLCSGCGSEFIVWFLESLLTKVTWVPRGTVMFCGQTELLEMVIVVDVELAVHVPPVDGPIELVELQAAVSAAIVPARTA